jgi:hypothetical protein
MTKFLILLLIGTLWACDGNTLVKQNPRLLKLELQPNGYLGVGYGEVYPCKVLNVLEGDFASDSLLLTILVGDTLNSNKLASAKRELVIAFEKNKENEPYQIMPISGMVDPQKTSWLITEIEVKEN